ncbi:MAG: SIS domain-containing protein, partial [Burkholderiales bacterium]|nr:SIS domain-containing protein [Anaerolineae bacterium]
LAESETRNAAALEQAAEMVAVSLQADGMLHTFGTGHGHLLAEEIFYRAGSLVTVNAILDPTLMLHISALASTAAERLPGYAEVVLERYTVNSGDVLIIASNSGRNAVPIEMALAAQKRGLKVIALTSMRHSQSQPSRHASGQRLYDIADVVLDNCGEIGDAALTVEGVAAKVGPTSTVIGAALLHALLYTVIEKLATRGFTPPVTISANIDHAAADEQARLFQQYRHRIRHL